MKTIVLVIPTLQSGGMERVMSVVGNFLSTKEVKVHILLYGKNPKVFYTLNSNINVIINPHPFNDNLRGVETLKRMYYLRSVVKSIKPNCVLSFGTLWNRFVLISMLGSKIPIYISDRGNPSIILSDFQRFLERLLYPSAAGIIAQTDYAYKRYIDKSLNKNIRVIPNPIIKIGEVENKREKVILSVGRLISTKHFDRLISIFSRINNHEWKLIIVGGDALKQQNSKLLQQQINRMGLQNNILLTGTQKNIETYLLKASLFAFTSSSEGFPNVIGEAMSAGLPVVAYDCVAGPSDMIEDGKNGYLIPLFDDVTFEEKLRYLIENEEERVIMGTYARESIKKFSVENIGEDYYKFLLNEN